MLGVGGDGGGPEVDVPGGGGEGAVEDGAGVARGRGRGYERDGGAGGEREAPEEELSLELPHRCRGHRAAGEPGHERWQGAGMQTAARRWHRRAAAAGTVAHWCLVGRGTVPVNCSWFIFFKNKMIANND